MNKQVVTVVLILLFSLSMSIVFHELTHYLLLGFDEEIAPVGFDIYPNCEKPFDVFCVKTKWSTENVTEQETWWREKYQKEEDISTYVGYLIGVLFSTFLVYYSLKKEWL